jgi:hypothetical protein
MATGQDIVEVTVGFDLVTATAFEDRVDDGASFSGAGT